MKYLKPEFEIAGRKVGYSHDPLVIAEIGINHEGSIETAIEMVDSAINAGAEIIKHQTHIIEDEMSKEAKDVIPGNAAESIYEIMERCALNEDEEFYLKEYIEKKGAIFISTPFSRAAADRLHKFNVQAYKIGSGECNNYPLVSYVASFGKPMIISTGMNNIDSIKKTVEIIENNNVSYALLHCTNVYPTPDKLVRLGAMNELSKEFPNAVIGLSDHTIDNIACLGAVANGASILERHFTDRMDRPGPDIVCSMDPEELSSLIKSSKRMSKMRGGNKGIVDEEVVTSDFAYASVVAIKDIKKGDELSLDNIWVKRPGNGELNAEDFAGLLGLKASKDITNDSQIKKSDVSL